MVDHHGFVIPFQVCQEARLRLDAYDGLVGSGPTNTDPTNRVNARNMGFATIGSHSQNSLLDGACGPSSHVHLNQDFAGATRPLE